MRQRERETETERERERQRQRERERETERQRESECEREREPLLGAYSIAGVPGPLLLLTIIHARAHTDTERMLLIGTQFSNLLTAVDAPAEAA